MHSAAGGRKASYKNQDRQPVLMQYADKPPPVVPPLRTRIKGRRRTALQSGGPEGQTCISSQG